VPVGRDKLRAMQIIVLGAGAIGSLYGAKLTDDNDVTLIARAEHAAAINAHGLRIEGIESRTVRVQAATAIDRLDADALILLTTKVPDSAAALHPIEAFVRDDTTIVCLQNGLGSEQIARAALRERGVVLRGITQFGAIFQSPGVIRYMAAGYTIIEKDQASDAVASVLTAAGLDCRLSPDIVRDVWHKLVVNCVVNPITAILGCEVGAIANPQLEPLKRLVIDECVAVAATQGITLDGDFIREIDDFFRPSLNLASMLQDLRRGHATEIDYMNGAIAALAARHNIPCPVNSALTAIIKAMEAHMRLPRSD
jgi:2-dehydropantoate 2-reductase